MSEQFLTPAPKFAGRKDGDGRLGMLMGRLFAPRNLLPSYYTRELAARESGMARMMKAEEME